MRVLIVDDSAFMRQAIAQMLQDEPGVEVVGKGRDGKEGLDLFRREQESLSGIILDLSMPKLDGEEVFYQARAIRSDVPVLLLSGFAQQDVLERFRGAERVHTLQKPARMHDFLRHVRELLS